MSESLGSHKICVIIGASHAGVNFAFSLRKEGWKGEIILYDKDSEFPYHRPPLSKGYLTGETDKEKNLLRSRESFEKGHISLNLGIKVKAINREEKYITLADNHIQKYDKLILATGARPLIPSISGLEDASNLFTVRNAQDALQIQQAFEASPTKRVVVIGGGFIGLEVAASLCKMGAEVQVLEREDRLLARVTSAEISTFFEKLHTEKGVQISTGKLVVQIESNTDDQKVICADGSEYVADLIIVGVGIQVNVELAEAAGLEIENGIRVDSSARTNDENIYAIGDCTFHFNSLYQRFIRLESVQNAADQAKVAAAAICGKNPQYDSLPWFWSDQYEIKLQMAGLSFGYDEALLRKEEGKELSFSVWYFKDGNLLAVDAINNAKAYILGMRFVKSRQKVDRNKLIDPSVIFKPANLLVE